MRVFTANNSNDMAVKVYTALQDEGVIANSRNGRVLKFEGVVGLCYKEPWHRANFTPGRDANPFFHVAESMWMLAGRDDVEFVSIFNSKMHQYSDDGEVFNAAYGYRMRQHFGTDQLVKVVEILKKDKDSRQAVVQLWSTYDLVSDTKDKACNLSMVFSVVAHKLELTVFNRSNDAVYGNVTGANPVHMSYFQQWVANQLNLGMGDLTFVSNNLHVYLDLYDKWDRMEFDTEPQYVPANYGYRLGSLEEIEYLCLLIDHRKPFMHSFKSVYLDQVVKPLMNLWLERKYLGHTDYSKLEACACPALREACKIWLNKRGDKS